jgi:hypothetical protein
VDSFFLKKHPSSLSNVCHSFLKLKKKLKLIIKRTKGLELIKMISITNLNIFGLIMFLTLQIMDLKNVALTKIIHIMIKA